MLARLSFGITMNLGKEIDENMKPTKTFFEYSFEELIDKIIQENKNIYFIGRLI